LYSIMMIDDCGYREAFDVGNLAIAEP
jgi:hypothetical protein